MRHLPAPPAAVGPRPGRRLLALPLIVAALAAGCAEPAAPDLAPPSRPNLIREVDRSQLVLNVQLRAIDDPNIVDDPNLRPHGHLQLRLTRLADGSVRLAWKGQVHNPGGQAFTGWSLDALGSGDDRFFVALKEVDGITARRIDVEGATGISAALAARLYGTPDTIEDPNIRVVFHTLERPRGAIAGTL